MTGREAVLEAFDRLFEVAARKLEVACSAEERAEAREAFVDRFGMALTIAEEVEIPELPADVMASMEGAIEQLTPAQVAGLVASGPLVQQTQEMARAIAFRQAEQRLLEHLAAGADTRYGH